MAEKLIVGMAGFGTVGSSVYQVLKRNAALIHTRAGKQIEIKRVVCRKTDKVYTLSLHDALPISEKLIRSSYKHRETSSPATI